MGILVVGVVTKPFQFEGVQRTRCAEEGILTLQQCVDTLIVIPNQNLFKLATEQTTFADAFKMADRVLYSGVRGITDLMIMPGLINLDFADIRTTMSEMGTAMMGTGEASGENRAIQAAEEAIANPLLDETSMRGAKGLLINITGGPDITLFEVDEAANRVREEVDSNAHIIFGSTFDANMQGYIRVSVVATGIERRKNEAGIAAAPPKTQPSLFEAPTKHEPPTSLTQEPQNDPVPTSPTLNLIQEESPMPKPSYEEPEVKPSRPFFSKLFKKQDTPKEYNENIAPTSPAASTPQKNEENYYEIPAFLRQSEDEK